ncbi:MAG TPA: roadblock/LC7 domain-containing protein [Candidatus Methanoperedens sp.]
MKGGKTSEILNNIMLDLKKVDGVKIIAVGTRDGFLIGEPQSDEPELLTLMSATMLKAAENITIRHEKVSPGWVMVDFEGGKIITTLAGHKALITVMTAEDASLSPIIAELERAAQKIKEIL